MTRERQIKKQEEVKKKILDAAKEIITENGFEGLSIRKITNKLNYSPGIIYHYFKDKNEIIETLVVEGYQRILASQKIDENNVNDPKSEIRKKISAYIDAVLKYPEEYKAFMMSHDPKILNKTRILQRGISKKSKTIGALTKNIQRGIDCNLFKEYDAELTAQILWAGAYGLIIRLITEKDITDEQKNRLISHHFKILFKGIIKEEK